jgi:3-hydroxyanthranilic acid dioxygenase
MKPLIAFNLWQWIEEYRQAFKPPVGNKVIWEDSQFTAMVIRGPNARRDFHVDPSDELFYMLKGNMVLEYMQDGKRQEQVIREGNSSWCQPSRPTRRIVQPTPGGWWSRSSARPSKPKRCCGSVSVVTPNCTPSRSTSPISKQS